jgi:hypothetical protein
MTCYDWHMNSANHVQFPSDHDVAAEHTGECRRVHARLTDFAKQRAALDAKEARDLVYAEELQIWKAFGHTTMLAYLEAEMGYGPHTAGERLRVAHALADLPLTAGKLGRASCITRQFASSRASRRPRPNRRGSRPCLARTSGRSSAS